MSTDAQLNADYFLYVCYYIYSINGDSTVLDDGYLLFSLEDDGNGPFISDWKVPNISKPTVTQLKLITPAQITTGKKFREINRMTKLMPKLMTLFRDVYNRVGMAVPLTIPTYSNDQAMANYFVTKF